MKDQPQLEAWIGTADTNFVAFAQLDGFVEARMIVAVEHRPNLIGFFKRVSAVTATPSEPQR